MDGLAGFVVMCTQKNRSNCEKNAINQNEIWTVQHQKSSNVYTHIQYFFLRWYDGKWESFPKASDKAYFIGKNIQNSLSIGFDRMFMYLRSTVQTIIMHIVVFFFLLFIFSLIQRCDHSLNDEFVNNIFFSLSYFNHTEVICIYFACFYPLKFRVLYIDLFGSNVLPYDLAHTLSPSMPFVY